MKHPEHQTRRHYPDVLAALDDAHRVQQDLLEALGEDALLISGDHLWFLAQRALQLIEMCQEVEVEWLSRFMHSPLRAAALRPDDVDDPESEGMALLRVRPWDVAAARAALEAAGFQFVADSDSEPGDPTARRSIPLRDLHSAREESGSHATRCTP